MVSKRLSSNQMGRSCHCGLTVCNGGKDPGCELELDGSRRPALRARWNEKTVGWITQGNVGTSQGTQSDTEVFDTCKSVLRR